MVDDSQTWLEGIGVFRNLRAYAQTCGNRFIAVANEKAQERQHAKAANLQQAAEPGLSENTGKEQEEQISTPIISHDSENSNEDEQERVLSPADFHDCETSAEPEREDEGQGTQEMHTNRASPHRIRDAANSRGEISTDLVTSFVSNFESGDPTSPRRSSRRRSKRLRNQSASPHRQTKKRAR